MKLIYRSLISLLVIYSMFIVTACPARSIEQAQKASANIAKYTNAGVDLTRELYRSGFLGAGAEGLARKDAIADRFIVLAKAGVAFDAAAANAARVYGSSIPSSELSKLFAVFDSSVVSALVDILTSLKLIPVGGNYKAIIDSLRLAVTIIGGVFGQKSSTVARLAGA